MMLMRYLDINGDPAWGVAQEQSFQPLIGFTLTAWLADTDAMNLEAVVQKYGFGSAIAIPSSLLAPIEGQEVWAAGVTYLRSRDARQEEAVDGGDVYARVYGAARPEVFYKGNARTVVGHGGEVGIRADSVWNVPEPELGLVLNAALRIVGLTIGNDMSSRSIEGDNPLYLPQAKVYAASCALGPGILAFEADAVPRSRIAITISRAGIAVFSGETHTSQLKRTAADLIEHLGRSNPFHDGVVLLTGTGIVPHADVTLLAGDRIDIDIEGLGRLTNTVRIV
jgi:2-dehydro-3-deoxy-D-arabinonate dehydratase